MTGGLRTGKWIDGLYGDTPCVVAARRALRRRLTAVDRLLVLAADHAAEDVEYVHQLRVASRRSAAALRSFRYCSRVRRWRRLRGRIRAIRRAASRARRDDVHLEIFTRDAGECPEAWRPLYALLLEEITESRAAAQESVRRVARGARRLGRGRRIDRLLRRRGTGSASERRSGNRPEACLYSLRELAAHELPPMVRRVRGLLADTPHGPADLHVIRLGVKKLRYAMEVFAGCFPARFKEEIYPRVEQRLEHLGGINDYFEVVARLEEWAEYWTHPQGGNGKAGWTSPPPEMAGGAEPLISHYRTELDARYRRFMEWWISPAASGLFEELAQVVEASPPRRAGALGTHSAHPVTKAAASEAVGHSHAAQEDAGGYELTHRRVAAIDVGSNSIRLVVGETDPVTKFRVVEDMKETTRLGSGVDRGGRLDPKAMEGSVNAIARMRQVAEGCHVDRVRAVGTAALREAANTGEFLAEVEKRTGLSIEVIDPEYEARLAFSSVANTFELDDRRVAVVDIGGGSTEVMLSSGGVIDAVHPLPLGTVRLTERFACEAGQTGRDAFEAMSRQIDKVIRDRFRKDQYRPYLIIGTGGTFTSLARVAIRHGSPPGGSDRFPFAVRGYELRRHEVSYFLEWLRRMSPEERRRVPGLSTQRSEIIVAGLGILERLMQHFGVERVRVHDGGIRDGLLAEMVDDFGFRTPPLRHHSDAALQAVRRFAERSRYEKAHSEHVAALALSIFDQLAGHEADASGTWASPESRDLLHAAGILHDAGMLIAWKRHHKHSYDMVRHAELPTFNRREVEVIAHLCRYHRRRGPRRRHRSFRRLGDDDQRLVGHLAGILRIADGLDRTHAQRVSGVRVTPEAERTTFTVFSETRPTEDLRWGRRKGDVFEKAFHTRVRLAWARAPVDVPRGQAVRG